MVLSADDGAAESVAVGMGITTPRAGKRTTPIPDMLNRLSDSLETGEVDLAIYPVLLDPEPFDLRTQVDPELQRRTLFRDSFRCFVRRDHPKLAGKRLALKAYTAQSHILVSPGGEGPGVVDHFLRARGLERRIALRVPHFASALEIAAKSDLVLTAPASLNELSIASALTCHVAPIDLPEHAITMMWHERFTADPAHRWFRQLMVDVTDAIPSLPPQKSRKRRST